MKYKLLYYLSFINLILFGLDIFKHNGIKWPFFFIWFGITMISIIIIIFIIEINRGTFEYRNNKKFPYSEKNLNLSALLSTLIILPGIYIMINIMHYFTIHFESNAFLLFTVFALFILLYIWSRILDYLENQLNKKDLLLFIKSKHI